MTTATVTRPASSLPDPGSNIDAEPIRDYVTNILAFLEAQTMTSGNVKVTGTDAVMTVDTSQTVTLQKTFENVAAAAGGVREVTSVGLNPASGTPATGDGPRLALFADNAAGAKTTIGAVDSVYTTATGGAEYADLVFYNIQNATLTEALRLDASTGGMTLAGAQQINGTVTVGVNDTGYDVKFFGASAGAYMEWDESADQLRIMGASADATTSTGKLLLATSLTDVNANDVLGKIDFQAPHEAGGTDAITVAASIQAIAQGTFAAALNATDLIFYTGHSEAATEKLRVTSQGEIGIGGANYGTDGQVLTSGGAGAAPAWETPTVGDITGVTAGVGLSGGGTTGTLTLALDLSELSAVTPTSGDSFSTLDNDGANEQRTTTDALATLFSGTGLTASSAVIGVDAAQTGITSLLATDIKIGEDDQTKIDFEIADEIHFYAANVEQAYFADNIFGPQSDSDVDLGTTGVRWKDLYVDSITATDQITATGFTGTLDGILGSGAAAAATVTTLAASGAVTVGVDDTGYDVKFFGATAGNYMLYDESADTLVVNRTDATTYAPASINQQAIKIANDSTTTGSANAIWFQSGSSATAFASIAHVRTGSGIGDLVFSTDSGTTTERMRITSAGNVGIGTASPGMAFDVLLSGTKNTAGSAVPTVALFTGPQVSQPLTAKGGMVSIQTNDAQAINVAATLGFGGRYLDSSAVATTWASAAGAKENGTTNNLNGYFTIHTNAAGTLTEALRIDSAQHTLVGLTSGHASYRMSVGVDSVNNIALIGRANGTTDEATLGFYHNDASTVHGYIQAKDTQLHVRSAGGFRNSGDNEGFYTGADDDLSIIHNGANGFIESGTGNLYLECAASSSVVIGSAAGDETFALFTDDAGVTLYHDAVAKLFTAATGVGIGNAASEAWHASYTALQIGGAASLMATTTQAAGDTSVWSHNAYYDATNSRWEYISTVADDEASQISMTNGTMTFNVTATAGADDAEIEWVPAMHITSAGNVGIGVTPAHGLHVQKNPGAANTPVAWIHNSGNVTDYDGTVISTTANNSTVEVLSVRANTTTYNGGNSLFTVIGDGKVGIGVAAPLTKLHVKHGGQADLRLDANSGSGISWDLQSKTDGTFALQDADNAEIAIQAVANGKVSLYHNGTEMLKTGSAGFVMPVAGAYAQVTGSGGTGWAIGSTGGNGSPATATGTTLGFHHWNGSSTWTNPVNITAASSITNPVDDAGFYTGASDDLRMYHASGTSYILNATGPLVIKQTANSRLRMVVDDVDKGFDITNNAQSETMFQAWADGAVNLYFNNAVKLATKDGGVTMTGNATATTYMYAAGGFYVGSDSNTNTLLDDASNGSGSTALYIGNAAITVSSDLRAKRDIVDYSGSALDVIDKARVVEFDYIPEMIGDTGSGYGPSSRGRYVGTIAQEMKEWAPWAINDGEGDPEGEHIWKAEYDHVVPLLLKGIQELREELNQIKGLLN